MAELESTDNTTKFFERHQRRKRQTDEPEEHGLLAPFAFSNIIGHPAIFANSILSPHAFINDLLSPRFLASDIISPRVGFCWILMELSKFKTNILF
jgi:hypothetical protein